MVCLSETFRLHIVLTLKTNPNMETAAYWLICKIQPHMLCKCYVKAVVKSTPLPVWLRKKKPSNWSLFPVTDRNLETILTFIVLRGWKVQSDLQVKHLLMWVNCLSVASSTFFWLSFTLQNIDIEPQFAFQLFTGKCRFAQFAKKLYRKTNPNTQSGCLWGSTQRNYVLNHRTISVLCFGWNGSETFKLN